MLTIIIVIVVIIAAVLLSAWLLIRQFRDPLMTAHRVELNAIVEQINRDITDTMNSSTPKSERLHSAIQFMEDVISQVNELERRYQRRLYAGEIKADRCLVEEIDLVRTCMRNARAKLQTELNKD